VWDAKHGLGEYIEDIRYHTQPHHFRFLLVDGRVQVTYKYWNEDPEWQPEVDEDEDDDGDEEDEPLCILKDGYIPVSALPVVSPNLDSLNLDQVMADLSKLPQDYLTEGNKKEWDEFVEKLRSSGVTRYTSRAQLYRWERTTPYTSIIIGGRS
jgi:hypothetical protein